MLKKEKKKKKIRWESYKLLCQEHKPSGVEIT